MPKIQKLIEQFKIIPVQSEKKDLAQNQRLITGIGKASFVHVWEPGPLMNEGDTPKYSIQMLMPKSDTESIKELTRVIANAAANEWGSDVKKWPRFKYDTLYFPAERLPDSIDPDNKEEVEEYFEINPHLKDVMIFSSRNQSPPGVVDKYAKPIMDQDEFYSGCTARISVFAKAYNQPASKGVTLYLNNVMKIDDGDSLGGGGPRSAESDFAQYASDSSSTPTPDEDDSGF